MRLFSVLPTAAFAAAFLAATGPAAAQNGDLPVVEDFAIFPTQIIGQTCVESADKETKCATLTADDAGMFITVATLAVPTHGSRDLAVQFCAKVEDEMFQELECQAVVDGGDPAPPGAIKPTENPNDTIYTFCFLWLDDTAGIGKGLTTVEVQCSRKEDNMEAELNINDYSVSVFAK